MTLSWYFLSVDPASLAAVQTYSPLSIGETEARISSVPSSRMDTPGSLPVSSWPLRNQRITGLGRPEEGMETGTLAKEFQSCSVFALLQQKICTVLFLINAPNWCMHFVIHSHRCRAQELARALSSIQFTYFYSSKSQQSSPSY